jgi:hypothetical protein
VRINCFEWTDVLIVKDSIHFELRIPVEHQALIFDGRILQDSEKVFDLSSEMKKMQGRAWSSRILSLDVILVTYLQEIKIKIIPPRKCKGKIEEIILYCTLSFSLSFL